jgi:hypothetical protein
MKNGDSEQLVLCDDSIHYQDSKCRNNLNVLDFSDLDFVEYFLQFIGIKEDAISSWAMAL